MDAFNMKKIILLAISILISSNAMAAISRIASQDALGTGSGTIATATYGATATSGDLLIASFYINNNAAVTMTGWTQFQNEKFSAADQTLLFYKLSAGNEGVVTATWTGSVAWKIHIYEYKGNANPIATDGTNTSSSASANTLTTGTITTINANDLIFANWGTSNSITNPIVNTSGFNLRQKDATIRLFDADGIVSSTNTYSINSQWTNTLQVGTCIGAFQAASSSGHFNTIQGGSVIQGGSILN